MCSRDKIQQKIFVLLYIFIVLQLPILFYSTSLKTYLTQKKLVRGQIDVISLCTEHWRLCFIELYLLVHKMTSNLRSILHWKSIWNATHGFLSTLTALATFYLVTSGERQELLSHVSLLPILPPLQSVLYIIAEKIWLCNTSAWIPWVACCI